MTVQSARANNRSGFARRSASILASNLESPQILALPSLRDTNSGKQATVILTTKLQQTSFQFTKMTTPGVSLAQTPCLDSCIRLSAFSDHMNQLCFQLGCFIRVFYDAFREGPREHFGRTNTATDDHGKTGSQSFKYDITKRFLDR